MGSPTKAGGQDGLPGLLALACFACALVAGCGPDAHLTYADETVRLSSSAITEIESSGGEDPELAPLIDRAQVRLGEVERSITYWRDHSGSLAYRTHAPCLRNALIALRDALVERSLPVPQDLDSAEAMLAEVASHECAP